LTRRVATLAYSSLCEAAVLTVVAHRCEVVEEVVEPEAAVAIRELHIDRDR